MPDRRFETQDAVRAFQTGGVLVLPTDTLPGFHALANNPEAASRIARIKGRSTGKPLLVLAADLEQALSVLGPLSEKQLTLARACWPGPFTLILPASDEVPLEVTAGTGTLGVRVPDFSDLRDLLKAAGTPLISTSCNRQGDPPLTEVGEAARIFADEVDGYWLPARSLPETGDAPVPSALVDLTIWPPRILREGPRPLPHTA